MQVKQTNEFNQLDGIVLFKHEEGGLSTKKELPEQVILQLELSNKQFTGKSMESIEIPVADGKTLTRYIIMGLGKESELKMNTIKKAAGKAIQTAKRLKLESVSVLLDAVTEQEEMVKTIAEASVLADYTFDLYKSEKKPSTLTTCEFVTDFADAVDEGVVLANTNLMARDLVNEPANVLVPVVLAERAVQAGKDYGFDVEVFDEVKIQALDMKAYWEVAKASENKPRFITMRYMGNPDSDEILGFVGKGLTFDTGGYSLKPAASMLTMKSDMGGSAAVIGAISAVAKRQLKINVIAVVAACENMISGGAYRPGDIIGSRGGKTIFIQSADAEGRLTLIDAVDYIIKDLKATKVIDIATLTGAALVALGKTTTGVVSNNDDFFKTLEDASEVSGERVWRMPMFPEYKEILKHKEADLTNATRMAGMITAGMFIGEFVGETPWIHMDIAGTSWTEAATECQTYGATGAGVKNLYYIAKSMA